MRNSQEFSVLFLVESLKRVNISEGCQNEVFDHQRVLFLKLEMCQACVGGEGDQCPK